MLPVRDFPALDSGRKGAETAEDAGSEGDMTILRKGGEFRAGGSVSRYSFEFGEGERLRDWPTPGIRNTCEGISTSLAS